MFLPGHADALDADMLLMPGGPPACRCPHSSELSMTPRRSVVVAGLALVTLAAVWRYGIAQRWTQRIPPGWSFTTRFAGTQTYPGPDGKLPARDQLDEYTRELRVVDERGRPDSVRITHTLTVIDPKTRKVTWEYMTNELVDPRTGARLEPAYRGDVALFPRETEKRTYRYRSNFAKGVPLAFQREETVAGLGTYLYSYRGRGEYTESYAGSPKFPGLPLPAGQEIRCADDQFYLRIWVEPHTGAYVKIDEGCPSGDYFYDVATGQQLAVVDRFSGTAAGARLLERVEEVQVLRIKYLFHRRYLPLSLLLLGLVLVGAGAWAERRSPS